MHEVRMHTHKHVADQAGRNRWRTKTRRRSPRWHPDQSREARLARKRDYNTAYRARLKQGLPGAMPKVDNPEKRQKREAYLRQKARFTAMGLNSKGAPFKLSPKGLRNVRLAQARRRYRERMERLAAAGGTNHKPTKRIQFVYPPPADDDAAFAPQTATAAEMEPTGATLETPHFCPKCGEDITRWKRG
jgi:predicted secreted protein